MGELTEKVSCCFFEIQEHRLSYGVYALKNQKNSPWAYEVYMTQTKSSGYEDFATEIHRRSSLKVTTS